MAVGSEASLFAGLRAGAADDDKLRVDAVCVGICDLDGRVGLESCWALLRDLERPPAKRLAEVAFRTYRLGEASLDILGDGAAELESDDCFDGDVDAPFVADAVVAGVDAATAAAGVVVDFVVREACW